MKWMQHLCDLEWFSYIQSKVLGIYNTVYLLNRYSLMLKCWGLDASIWVNFKQIVEELSNLINSNNNLHTYVHIVH